MTKKIVMKTICIKNCKSNFGPMTYNWKLMGHEDGSNEEMAPVTDFSGKTFGGKLEFIFHIWRGFTMMLCLMRGL